MRKLAFAAFITVLAAPAMVPTASSQSAAPTTIRTLACTRQGGPNPGCDVSCATGEKTILFVYDRVRSVAISEYAGNHTLIEVMRGNPDETITVLVGNVAHCTFNGLRDPGRRPAG